MRDSKVYQEISRYVEIEGQPFVVEILNVLDDTTDASENAREQLIERIRGYNEELYLDALTGAYNRRYYEDRIRKVRGHAGVAMIDLDDFKLYKIPAATMQEIWSLVPLWELSVNVSEEAIS